jgi:hypothetical protein
LRLITNIPETFYYFLNSVCGSIVCTFTFKLGLCGEKKYRCPSKPKFYTLNFIISQLIHVREQLRLKNVEMEAMERRILMLQEAEVQRQRERQLDQEEMDKNRRELQKVQSLQVRVYLSMTLFE